MSLTPELAPRIIHASCAFGRTLDGDSVSEHLYVLDNGKVINKVWGKDREDTHLITAEELLKETKN